MDFSYSEKVENLRAKLLAFMEEHVYPNEKVYDAQLEAQDDRWSSYPPILEELKAKARAAGLWKPLPARKRSRRGADEPRICAFV